MNNFGERAYILYGLKNEGTTSKGFMWNGYKAARFSTGIEDKTEIKEVNYSMN